MQVLDKVQNRDSKQSTFAMKSHLLIKPRLLCACYMGDNEGVFVLAL